MFYPRSIGCALIAASLFSIKAQQGKLPSVDYEMARKHEIKPHRGTIPEDGIREGFNQLRLDLTVSETGDVTEAKASGEDGLMKYWPQIQNEIYQWKYSPFEVNGKPSAAEVEEYLNFVPPERLPKIHVNPPRVTERSQVEITLERSGCFGSCPSYTITVGTNGIVFDGGAYVVVRGRHTAQIDATAVRALARKFVSADFYSMDGSYSASVTDCPTYVLSIAIDGQSQRVVDYMGSWTGMPQVVSELEEDVDDVASSQRWTTGEDGLVAVLSKERFDFKTYEAQVVLKAAAQNGQVETVRELLDAGVPLKSMPAPPQDGDREDLVNGIGWLNAASRHVDVLKVLLSVNASKDDQNDKDAALMNAADAGQLDSVRALIAYGANPNVDLASLTVAHDASGKAVTPGPGSVLIQAVQSGNPAVVREILRHRPNLEARGVDGQTAMFAAGDYRDGDEDGARVECVRLLAEAGANVNARDQDGNTPLHETFLTDVEEELLKLGANVNARNKDGETPIFTTVDDDAIRLFIAYGADLMIRNNKGQTVLEAAQEKGPARQEALRKAIADWHQRQLQSQ